MIFAAVGVIFLFVYQCTFFVACLTLDVRRQQAGRMDLLCCRTSSKVRTIGCCGQKWDGDTPDLSQRLIGILLPKVGGEERRGHCLCERGEERKFCGEKGSFRQNCSAVSLGLFL